MKSLAESLFDNNIKNKIVPEKLAYVLKKFFGDGIAVCKDHQGSNEWYEINPFTISIINGSGSNIGARIANYCKKIDGLDVKQDKLPNFNLIKAYKIGDDTYWIYINIVKYGNKRIYVSKDFYESGALPQDQKGIAERGWNEWQKQRL